MERWKITALVAASLVLGASVAPYLAPRVAEGPARATPTFTVDYEAIADAQRRVLEAPSDPSAWQELGDLLMSAGRFEEASAAWARAGTTGPDGIGLSGLAHDVLTDPDNDELWGDLGDQALAQGDRDAAVRYWREALRLDPDDSEWSRKLAEQGHSEYAEAALAQQVALDPANDELIGDLADLYRASGRTELAIQHYERAMALDPDDTEWSRKLAELGVHGALESVRQRMNTSTNDEVIGDMADVLWDAGHQAEACQGYDRAWSLDRDDSEWQRKRTRCATSGFRNGLAEVPPLVLSVDPSDPNTAVVTLERMLARGQGVEAERQARVLLRANPFDSNLRAIAARIRGVEPSTLLRELVDGDRGNDELWGDLGDAYLAAGRYPEALEAYQEAARIDPGDSEWSQQLMTVHQIIGPM